MEKINTSYTQAIICPYCGHKYHDSWEYNDYNDTNEDCAECGETFKLYVDCDVPYSTEKILEKEELK